MAKFAVVDVETTGFYFKTTDRVVEVAVVGVDESLRIEWTWSTLLNPNRDVGPVSIHGIAASEVIAAPAFADVAGHLAELLRGRVPVAHNASFDAHFLQAEYQRCGWDLSEILGYHQFCCTCVLSGRLIPEGGRSLSGLCQHIGIPNDDAHEALSDATATAELLRALSVRSGGALRYLEPVPADAWPQIPVVATEGLRRGSPAARPRHYLARLVDGLPPIQTKSPEATAYLGALDLILLDRQISHREHQQMTELAEQLGVGRDAALALNEEYLASVATAAWADGVITAQEREDLVTVANLLGFDEAAVDVALTLTRSGSSASACEIDEFRLNPGDRVVLTGDMVRTKGELTELAEAAGLRITGSVSGRTRLCVSADPDTLSNKGKDAQQKGVPIVTEQAFVEMLARLLLEDAR